MERSKNGALKITFYLALFSMAISLEGNAFAQFGGGGGGGGGGPQPRFPTPVPPRSVTALPFEGPAPWGTNPATIPGATISGAITGNGFVQEIVTLPGTAGAFWYQRIESTDGTFLSESYVKKDNAFENCQPGSLFTPQSCPNGLVDTTGSPNPTGNAIFNVVVKDPTNGMTNRAWMNGFSQPINLHSDVVDVKAAGAANVNGFNEMDMHFSQTPFRDAGGVVSVRQDIAVFITSLAGVQPTDVTQSEGFIPGTGNMLRRPATAADIGSGGGGGGGFGGGRGGGGGPIDFWSDLTVVKIVNPTTQQIVTFSRCNDFGDPGRLEGNFRQNLGSRGGCTGGGSGGGRPAIPDHSSDSFQLTPINWERWGGGGAASLNSGGPGGSGGVTTFPGSGSSGGGRGR